MTRRSVRFSTIFSASLVALAMLTACGGGVPQVSVGSSASSNGIEGSMVHVYSSFAELRQDADAVVVGTVSSTANDGPADQEKKGDIDALLITVAVQRVLSGDVGGAGDVIVRELADADSQPIAFSPAIGKSYVFYLNRFSFTPGVWTGQYTITGEQGAYEVTTDGPVGAAAGDTVATRAKGVPPGLPDSATLSELVPEG